jgi:hypothetical protein
LPVRVVRFNGQRERRETAAAGAQIQSELNG